MKHLIPIIALASLAGCAASESAIYGVASNDCRAKSLHAPITSDNGMGPSYLLTNDTRWCSKAGIRNPVFDADGGSGDGGDGE